MSNPNALYLLADHIKLSLLERKRAQALGLQSDSQDGHVSRSLEQFRDGLEALRAEQQRLEDAGQTTYVVNIHPKTDETKANKITQTARRRPWPTRYRPCKNNTTT